MSRRAKEKYPALNKNSNLKSRRFFIETHYINGVKGVDGRRNTIRPLNEEEKAWLNKFYSEHVVTSFKKDGTDFNSTDEERRQLYKDHCHRYYDLFNLKQRTASLESLNIHDTQYTKLKSSQNTGKYNVSGTVDEPLSTVEQESVLIANLERESLYKSVVINAAARSMIWANGDINPHSKHVEWRVLGKEICDNFKELINFDRELAKLRENEKYLTLAKMIVRDAVEFFRGKQTVELSPKSSVWRKNE